MLQPNTAGTFPEHYSYQVYLPMWFMLKFYQSAKQDNVIFGITYWNTDNFNFPFSVIYFSFMGIYYIHDLKNNDL